MKYEAGINVIRKTDTPIHDWYRFVLSYPPHLPASTSTGLVFTPATCCVTRFVNGTTLVEAKKLGIPSVGCDAHPFAVLVSSVKTNWTLDVDLLSSLLRRILTGAEEKTIQHRLPPLSFYTLFVKEEETHQRNGYRLSEDEEKLLPMSFLSERPLRRLLILRDEIVEQTEKHSQEIRDFFLLAMAHVIANGAGNFAFGPEIYRTKG